MAKSAAKSAILEPPKSAADTRRIFAALATQHPNADTELNFTTPYELLVATILSAQCTDERVNQVTPALFKRYPDAKALAKATTEDLEPQIQSTGFFRAKSRSLLGMATEVVETHAGEVPRTMDELVKLPGVGRKTANVVLGHALGVPGLPVDRHVLRVAGRIGIANSEEPEVVEQQLGRALPPGDWTRASDTLILHGRRICKPKPLCPECVVRPDCLYYLNVVAKLMKPARKRRSESGSIVARGPGREGQVGGVPPAPSRKRASPKRSENGPPPAKLKNAVEAAAKQSRSEDGSAPEDRRAAKPRGTARQGAAGRRAEQPRSTARAGGAPRESKNR